MSHNTSQKQPQYHVELNSPMVEVAIKGGRTTSDHSSSNSNSNFIDATTYNTTTSPPPPSSPWQPKQSPTLTQPSLLKQPTKFPPPPKKKKEKKKRIHCHHPQNDHHQNYQKKIATTAQHPSRLFSLKFQVWFQHRSGTPDTAWQRTDQRVEKEQKAHFETTF